MTLSACRWAHCMPLSARCWRRGRQRGTLDLDLPERQVVLDAAAG